MGAAARAAKPLCERGWQRLVTSVLPVAAVASLPRADALDRRSVVQDVAVLFHVRRRAAKHSACAAGARGLTSLRSAVENAAACLPELGYVLNEGFYHPDVNAVGAPAFDKQGKPQYVVSCGGPALKIKFLKDDIGPRIAQLGRKITVALAGRPA